MMVRKKTISIWTYVNKNLQNFLNPFYQKDEDPQILALSSMMSSDNMIMPMNNYVSIRLFKEHFFKYNQEHHLEQQAAFGSPMSKLNRVMMKEMDLHIENTELKKLIKSMCEELSKIQAEKAQMELTLESATENTSEPNDFLEHKPRDRK